MQTNHFSHQLADNPEHLFDGVMRKLSLKNDAALSRALGVAPPVISKIRRGKLPLRYAVLVRILDITDLSMGELVELSCAQASISHAAPPHDGRDAPC